MLSDLFAGGFRVRFMLTLRDRRGPLFLGAHGGGDRQLRARQMSFPTFTTI